MDNRDAAKEAIEAVKTLKHYYQEAVEPVDDDDEEEEEEEEEDLRVLKRIVFDEMPQNPHYTPLKKYSGKIRECMILGLELAFTILCERIRNLVDVQSFLHGLEDFNEQLSQLKEMGYNVEKVSKRIDILKGIVEVERASRAAAEKFEDEVRDEEARVINLQAAIKESEDIIANRKSKIEALKNDSSDRISKFASTAKSKALWPLLRMQYICHYDLPGQEEVQRIVEPVCGWYFHDFVQFCVEHIRKINSKDCRRQLSQF